MTTVEKKQFCKRFIDKKNISKNFSFNYILENSKQIYLFIDNSNVATIKTEIVMPNEKKKKVILDFFGKRDLKKYSNFEIKRIYKEMYLFVSYMRELKLLKEIENEQAKLPEFLNSLNEKLA